MLFDELQRFLGEFETNNFTVSNNENTTWIFTVWDYFFSLFYELLTKSLAQNV